MTQSRPGEGRIALAVLLASIGLALIAGGFTQLKALSAAYLTSDVLRTESPFTFYAWLASLLQDHQAESRSDSRGDLSRRVADRLMIMPLPARRRIAISMARQEFWADISADAATQRAAKEAALDGVLLALQTEPGAGDLYFCAAWLETTLSGFTERPRRLLRASHIFSKHELDIAVERLLLAPLIWTFLDDAEKTDLKRDLDLVTQLHSNSAAQILRELEEQGVSFD